MNTNTTTITAPDITCNGCANSIKKALNNLEGISQVEVDVKTKQVTVKHDEKASPDEIAATLDKAGFSTV